VSPEGGSGPAVLGAALADVFAVRPDPDGAFTAIVPDTEAGRPFGGHLIGLAVRAAAATVSGPVAGAPHAVHARFVRAGRTGEPVRIDVARLHDGRSTAVRRLTVDQGSRILLTADVSFHADEEGDEWQAAAPGVLRLPPVAVSSPIAQAVPLAPFEIRAENEHTRGAPARLHPFWARSRAPIGDDPVLHACALAVLTDIGVTGSARRPGSTMRVQRAAVTLDHALWLHRPFRADDWLQVAVRALVNSGGRATARGEVSREDGTLVASFTQEVLLREPGAPV
jgi:acyl-CoA thioesterase-2